MHEIRKGTYRHYKGQEYELVDVAKNSETLEEFVVYRALYGNRQLWIRPKEMFFEAVRKDGKEFPRFEYVTVAAT
jgi:cyclomaltodextrinase / maltogenic alpha-amylase / neopullulanase